MSRRQSAQPKHDSKIQFGQKKSPSKSRIREGPESIDGTAPRYVQIARQLAGGIASGQFPVGSQIPTEMELCQLLGISRFTAREAVRLLVDDGLVARRQRVGTTVLALPHEGRYSLAVSSLRDLLQYAQHTELRLSKIRRLIPKHKHARELGLPAGVEWIYALGIRSDTKTSIPFCVTHLYLNPQLPRIEEKLRRRKTAVYATLEDEYGIVIESVDQELQGITLDTEDAAVLGVAPGHPALRIIRRYFDSTGRLVEIADNRHSGDRFSYRMQLAR